ncbi:phage tail tape measure protein [Salmonella enterica subsp. salamae]|uniref:phage tail tape measure protein n=1 Tax=Salmonella enterica TaxID=28901 RepID=UPI0009E69A6D|nr:phage tail tape measure protein [Salmonella enterica]EBQ5245612.1 phage tail tape measure protein [Salmonella enterica subsp. salamae]
MMADEIASLILKVESTGVAKATSALDNLTKSGLRAEDTAGALSDAWGGLGKSAQTATGYQDRYVQSLKRYVKQGKEAQEQAAVGFFKELDAIKQLSSGMKELERIQSQVQQAKNREAISQGDYLTLISEITAKKMLMRDAEDLETRSKVRFIQRLKEQVTAQKLSRAEMLRVQAAELGVSNAADVYIRKMEAAAKSTHALGLKSAMARRELGVLIGELARGNLGALRGSSITLANRAGWIDKLFTLRGLGIAGVIGGIGTAVYALGKAWYEGSQEAVEFNKQLILTGSYAGKTVGQLQDMARALAVDGVTQHDAAGVLAQVVGSGAFRGNQIETVTRAAVAMQHATGEAVDKTIANFRKLYDEPTKGSEELNNQMHYLTASQYQYISSLERRGDKEAAGQYAADEYSKAEQQRSQQLIDNLGWIERAIRNATGAWKQFWDAALDIGRKDTTAGRIEEIRKELNWIDHAVGGKVVFGKRRGELEQELSILQFVMKSQQGYADAQQHLKDVNEEGIKAQIVANKYYSAGLTNAEKKVIVEKEINKAIKANADAAKATQNLSKDKRVEKWSDDYIAKIRAGVEKLYKDPKPNKAPAYHDDEATRLLTQYREKGAKLQGEINNANLYSNQKLTESEKELLALETRIAGMKDKTLTAADKSILEHQKELEEALRINAEKEKELQHQEALNRLQAKSVQLAQQHRQQLEKLRATGEFDVASMGMGNKQRQRAQEEFNLKQRFANEQEELDRSARKDGTYGSPEYFAQAAENAAALNDQLVQMKRNHEGIDAAQGEWVNGFTSAYQDFMDQGADVAGMTKQVFSNAFNGMADSLAQFALTGKMNFKGFAVSVLSDLAKMEARIAASKVLGMLMNWGMSALGMGAAGAAAGSTPSGAYTSAAANLQFAKGGAISSSDLSMYSGQILTQPTFFKFAHGGGVAGEAGPEAILPLARDSRGYMGVRLSDKGGKQQLPPIQITVTQHIDQRGTDQNDQAAAQRNNQQLAKMVSDLVDTKVNRALDTAMRPGGKLAGVR